MKALPNFIISYLSSLLSTPAKYDLVSLSEYIRHSHDYYTRHIKQTYHWKNILTHLLHTITTDTSEGYLLIDETDVDKSYSEKIQGTSWIYSHRKNKHILGYHLVVIVWSNGDTYLPLGWKVYNKQSGKTKIDLALELIKFCTNVLQIRPKAFLFDSLYASYKILRYLQEHGHIFYTQCPKNRLFNGKQLKYITKGSHYWHDTGMIKGKICVTIAKKHRKYYMTNDLSKDRYELIEIYKSRWKIEEVFRIVKQNFGFERCQCRDARSQCNHFGACFVLCALLQDTTSRTGLTVYSIKKRTSIYRESVHNYLNFNLLTMSA